MTEFEMIAFIVVSIGLVVFIVTRMGREAELAETPTATCICGGCGASGSPLEVKPGSLLIAVLLLICFVIPGVFYCLWREAAAKKVCPACGSPDMVPFGSPRGRQLLEAFGHTATPREAPPDEIHLRRVLEDLKSKGKLPS